MTTTLSAQKNENKETCWIKKKGIIMIMEDIHVKKAKKAVKSFT